MSASTFRTERAIPGAAGTESATSTLPGTRSLLVRPLTTPVAKELVERASVAEVMLTGWEQVGEHRFTVAAQWPRGHSFFAVGGRYHPLIAAETIRQSAILLAHTEYGVPLDRQLLVQGIGVSPRPERFDIGWTPATLELHVRVAADRGHDGTLTGLRVEVEIRRDAQPAATGHGTFACAAAAGGQAPGRHPLPRTAPAHPVPPQAVGRLSPLDVVLSATRREDQWRLHVDTGHPVFFDRRTGHVPDTILLEAACQATAMTLGRPCVPLDITTEFDRRAELGSPCLIEAHRIPGNGADGSEAVRVTGHHSGRPLFCSTVTAAAG
ncbi:ScbA/BarX family gamma-butyrolactone biosynthesis protein [Streptomyces sp. NPDC089424]|uniref:ScbA/BarX family gamma-butyrolactone biosynthesis protein n=1 Tax=Streptomyces sp. NPDC089424 TaxID=3365917 RepID=UPI0037F14E62